MPAMWIAGARGQVAPYWPYVQDDPALKDLMCGLVNRHVRSVLHDPYANAFNPNREGTSCDRTSRGCDLLCQCTGR